MLKLRKSADRGFADHGWLKSFHTFSFADYYDPAQMHFRDLRVINEDVIAPGMGFGTHGHDNMEIMTVVISGELEHKDSMGHESVIRPGDVQVMSAGTGITHSEYNHSKTEPVHLLQIWIMPNKKNVTPRYDQKQLERVENGLGLLVGSIEGDGPLGIHQDIRLYLGLLDFQKSISYQMDEMRYVWIQMISGALSVNGEAMMVGDGVAVSHETLLEIVATEKAEFLLFDLK